MASSKVMTTTNEHLPEDVILQILYCVPVRTLIRFSCTSKRWRSIISHPQFAKEHFKLAPERNTLSQRLLLSTRSQMQSLDLHTPSFADDSSVRKLTCPFKQPGGSVKMLGSCNGMVCVALDFHNGYYIWNPSTGLFLKLPNPGFVSQGFTTFNAPDMVEFLHPCGFGYVSATDDYKVIVGGVDDTSMPPEIFSSRTNSWKIMEPLDDIFDYTEPGTKAALSNEALHWVVEAGEIIAFDLAKEEFRGVPLPVVDYDEDGAIYLFIDVGVVFGGCLCVTGYQERNHEQVQFWVMMEYGVCNSWTKLFQFSMVPGENSIDRPVIHTESSMVVWRWKSWDQGETNELIRYNLLHKDVADCGGRYTGEVGECDMIKYDETLLWLNDHLGVEENVQRLGTQHEASASRNVEE